MNDVLTAKVLYFSTEKSLFIYNFEKNVLRLGDMT